MRCPSPVRRNELRVTRNVQPERGCWLPSSQTGSEAKHNVSGTSLMQPPFSQDLGAGRQCHHPIHPFLSFFPSHLHSNVKPSLVARPSSYETAYNQMPAGRPSRRSLVGAAAGMLQDRPGTWPSRNETRTPYSDANEHGAED